MNGQKTTASMKQALCDAARGRRGLVSSESYWAMKTAGLVTEAPAEREGRSFTEVHSDQLTEAGRAIGLEENKKREARNRRASASRHARADLMSSLGMRRTSGGWE